MSVVSTRINRLVIDSIWIDPVDSIEHYRPLSGNVYLCNVHTITGGIWRGNRVCFCWGERLEVLITVLLPKTVEATIDSRRKKLNTEIVGLGSGCAWVITGHYHTVQLAPTARTTLIPYQQKWRNWDPHSFPSVPPERSPRNWLIYEPRPIRLVSVLQFYAVFLVVETESTSQQPHHHSYTHASFQKPLSLHFRIPILPLIRRNPKYIITPDKHLSQTPRTLPIHKLFCPRKLNIHVRVHRHQRAFVFGLSPFETD